MTDRQELMATVSLYGADLNFAPWPDFETGEERPLLHESEIRGQRVAQLRSGATYIVLSEALLRALPLEIESLLRKWDDEDAGRHEAMTQEAEEDRFREVQFEADMEELGSEGMLNR